ncbi:MAG UNVERIFIED_CONTAM: hypothetical protein LVR18_49600 [Planctomycetaceae bacterium]
MQAAGPQDHASSGDFHEVASEVLIGDEQEFLSGGTRSMISRAFPLVTIQSTRLLTAAEVLM